MEENHSSTASNSIATVERTIDVQENGIIVNLTVSAQRGQDVPVVVNDKLPAALDLDQPSFHPDHSPASGKASNQYVRFEITVSEGEGHSIVYGAKVDSKETRSANLTAPPLSISSKAPEEDSVPQFKMLGAPEKRSIRPLLNYSWWAGYLLIGVFVQATSYFGRELNYKIQKRTSIASLIAGILTVMHHFIAPEGGGDRRQRFWFFVRSRLFSLQTFLYWLEGMRAEKTRYPSYDTRESIRQRDDYQCQVCGATGGPKGEAELHVDHVIPRKWGGSNAASNLRTLCHRCHGLRHLTAFRD